MMHLLSTIVMLLAAAPEFQATSLDGQVTSGALASLDAQQIALETADGRVSLPIETITGLARAAAVADVRRSSAVSVELMDQTVVGAQQYTVAGNVAHLKLSNDSTLEVPTKAIRSVRFGAVGAAKRAELATQWDEIVNAKASGDLLVVRKGDALDYVEGVQGDVDAEFCHFEVDKEPAAVKRAKVEGIVYFHPTTADLPETVGQLAAVDGSRVAIARAELVDGAVRVTTPSGIAVTTPLEEVARIDFSAGKIAYLSDLDPESAAYVPYFGLKDEPSVFREAYQFRRDVGFEQNPLRLDGKSYRKGLALQSRTVLTYKLPGKFRLFEAVAGIDYSVRESGDVKLEIRGDGKTLWQADVRGTEVSKVLSLDIAGVKRLEIVVDYGGELDIGDRLDLCEARVTK
jgi:hypothetical protein